MMNEVPDEICASYVASITKTKSFSKHILASSFILRHCGADHLFAPPPDFLKFQFDFGCGDLLVVCFSVESKCCESWIRIRIKF